MCRLNFCAAALLLLSACSSEEPLGEVADVGRPIERCGSELRSLDEVLNIAEQAINLLPPEEGAPGRGFSPRCVDSNKSVSVITSSIARGGDPDTLIYVVNYADERGFAMISAKRVATDLLAVTEKGSYDPETGSPIDGFNLWLDEMKEILRESKPQQQTAEAQSISIPKMYKTETDTTWFRKINPRVEVVWGQSTESTVPHACEGLECPNGIAGCANVAIAMAMSFVERPKTIWLQYKENVDERVSLSLKWGELKKYLSIYDSSLNEFPESTGYDIRGAISQLMRQIGYEAKSVYGDNGTGTDKENVPTVLRQNEVTSQSTWETGGGKESYETMFYNSNCILVLRGSSSQGGHEWVADGLKDFYVTERRYYSTNLGKTWTLETTTKKPEQYLIHQNWGWHGYCNGYYQLAQTAALNNNVAVIDFNSSREIIRVIH